MGHLYLKNKQILPEIIKFKETGIASEKFGEQLLLLARQISNKPGFIGYSWKDDMVSFAVLTCLKYSRGFNPEKTNNPFAYLTSIIINAFKAYLNVQKKHSNIKKELYDKQDAVDDNPHTSIDYSNLKFNSPASFLEEKKTKSVTFICAKCGIAQTQKKDGICNCINCNSEIKELQND